MIKRIIPSSGETLPVIGIGTWQVFDVTPEKYPVLKNVLEVMHNGGGTLIDSSPMYAKAEKAIGYVTSKMDASDDFFYATKVWTTGADKGVKQMNASFEKCSEKKLILCKFITLLIGKRIFLNCENGKTKERSATLESRITQMNIMKIWNA